MPLPEEESAGVATTVDWQRRWTVSWRTAGGVLVAPVRDVVVDLAAGLQPMRRFAWSRSQRHRPGLQFMVSTGRHHGFESLAEQQLLVALDFAGAVREVLSQPFRLRFGTPSVHRDHVPDVLVMTGSEIWVFDVRPAGRIRDEDVATFAATARVAAFAGWRYLVVTGWRPAPARTIGALAAQRRHQR